MNARVAWLAAFEREHGRRLRVLHVGNIANNAYLNAKFLRAAGVDAHVLSYDYYDIMATPEWEGSPRPDWFAQGPFSMCNRYLHALIDGHSVEQRIRRRQLALARHVLAPVALESRHSAWNRAAVYAYVTARRTGSRFATRVRPRKRTTPGPIAPGATRDAASSLIAEFDRVFPQRRDRLTGDDVEHWTPRREEWDALFDRYDVVQCYATDPIRALVSGARPYVAFEHGTLRDFTLGDDPISRMNALAYRLADHVFITNGDGLAYARQLEITAYTPMIHPIDVQQHRHAAGHTGAIRASYGNPDVLLLCPLRHDWAVKGTDVHLRALPTIIGRHGRGVVLLLCAWGAELERSRQLIDELGVSEHIVWLPPLDRPRLIAHMKAADVVLDQMALPHFGATAPQALAAGRPVIMSYEPESTAWIVDEPAPILAASDAPGVAAAVDQALDRAWRREFEADAARWVDTYHHPRRIVHEHCRNYEAILGAT